MSAPRSLLLARAYYFVYFGAVGCYVPFVNLYFRQIGLAGAAIGVLSALPPLLMLAAGPLWGALSDRFRIHRYLLPLATIGPILPSLLMARTQQLVSLAGLVSVASIFVAAVIPLIDSAVLDLIAGTPHSYGNLRVWGSLGFTAFTWVMGFVLKVRDLRWLFYGYAVFLGLAGLLALGLPARRQTWQLSFRASLRQLLRQPPLALFLVSAFLIGATLQASYSFFPLYLQALGGNPAWVGLAGALGALTETPVVFYSALLFAWLGVRGSLLLSYVMFAVRWSALALFNRPLPVLLTNLMHGATFAPFMVGSIAYVQEHTPPGLHATSQGLLTAVTFGLGAAAGALGGGWLYDLVGPARLFALAAGAALIGTLFLLLARRAESAEAKLRWREPSPGGRGPG